MNVLWFTLRFVLVLANVALLGWFTYQGVQFRENGNAYLSFSASQADAILFLLCFLLAQCFFLGFIDLNKLRH